jgi:hypothetical protein
MPRGGQRSGSGRPLKTPGEKRAVLNCRIKASNKEWLEQLRERCDKSIGELIDQAVEALKAQPDKDWLG